MKKNNIMDAGNIIAMKALKTTYSHNGLELFRPSPFNPLFEDLAQIASLAICEKLFENGYEFSELTTDEIFQSDDIVKSAYSACHAYIYSNRKEVNNRLYSTDENGNTACVTTQIEKAQIEMTDVLKRSMKPTDWKVCKYILKGYTTETIMRKMKYASKESTMRKERSVKRIAKKILIDNGYDVTIK